MEYGTIIVLAAAVLFYVRLTVLQRNQLKRSQAIQKELQKARGKQSASIAPEKVVGYRITSKPLVAIGALLILFGGVISFTNLFPASINEYWWLIITAGLVIMSLGIR